MKKIILSAALLSGASLNAYSQISAGTVSIGGGVNYGRSTTKNEIPPATVGVNDNYTSSSLSIQPIASYFISENLSIGINTGININRYKQAQFGRYNNPSQFFDRTYNRKERVVSLGPVARYYRFINDKFAVYGQLGAGYTNNYFSIHDYDYFNNSVIVSNNGRSQGFYANFSPGITFFPVKKIGIELSVGGLNYNCVTQKKDGFRSSNSYFYTNFGLSSLFLGGSIYLGRS
ncbi:outer membrane beta-barrel protein [Hymenobacter sp. BT507]|uniref:Outer membrane beta-barrel protein n=1 Tax=Hymenobacter citatus TaxID=2763506 RepID=A0ABR7MNR5_9BACT|nr:outer membrane beta-barrel protein [Hymenobacter citatus]MBC6612355.1 outer membrane beta-barrel protein [Hymenobacter citatus]